MSDYKFDPPGTTSLQQLMDAMDDERTAQHVAYINTMSHLEMGRAWRFYPSGHPYFNIEFPELVSAFNERWNELGGMTTAISKAIGWDR